MTPTSRPARRAPARAWTARARADTPLGPVTLVATDAGLAGLWFDDQAHHPGPLDAVPLAPDHALLRRAADELAAWWANPAQPFSVPLDPQGTPFQQAVWAALRRIAPGDTVSYGALASALGRPAAVRAVAAAIGRNPLSLVVPCHRVLGRDGALTGYAGGLARKQALLAREQALPATGRADRALRTRAVRA